MKKFVKLISLVLALLMVVAVFAACDNGDKDKDKGSGSKPQGDGSQDLVVMDWEGTPYRIIGKGGSQYHWGNHFEVWCEDGITDDVDTMTKAVWERNQDMLQNYGIDVVGTLRSDVTATADLSIKSGKDEYDLILTAPEKFNAWAIKGYLLDLNELPYINLEHDGWLATPNESLTIGGKLFYTTNKFLVQDKNRYWGIFYNRDLAAERNLGHFEDYVFDGTWTIDKVIEIAKAATFESDGQQGFSKNDNWGVGCSEYYNITQLLFGVGLRIAEVNSEGLPVLVEPTNDMMRKLDKVFELTSNPNAFWCDQMNGNIDWTDCADQRFHRGKILLEPVVLSELQRVGASIQDFSFGVLPNPKYDTNQEQYITIPNIGNGSLLGVPYTVGDEWFAGYALELITEKSVDTSYKAYIEVTCKLQKVQDPEAAKCLEIIYEGVVYDFAFVNDISGIYVQVSTILSSSSSNTWDSIFGGKKVAMQEKLDEIIAAYNKL